MTFSMQTTKNISLLIGPTKLAFDQSNARETEAVIGDIIPHNLKNSSNCPISKCHFCSHKYS